MGLRSLPPTEDRRRLAHRRAVRRLPARGWVVLLPLIAAGIAAAQPQSKVVVGHSVRGRAIVAYERGDASAPVTLVVGVIHGTEPAGLAVIRRLRTMPLDRKSVV